MGDPYAGSLGKESLTSPGEDTNPDQTIKKKKVAWSNQGLWFDLIKDNVSFLKQPEQQHWVSEVLLHPHETVLKIWMLTLQQ